MSDAPLVPGPLFGLRTWRIVRGPGPERLAAPQRGTPWPPGGGWLEAECPAGHTAPAPGCGCGVHAWHPRAAFARRVLASRFDLPGIVKAGGAVELHAEGFRAHRARPYAFVRVPTRNPYLVERLARAYGAQVVELRRPAELVALCRERGLGLSEAVVEGLLGAEVLARRRHDRARRRRTDLARVAAALIAAGGVGAAGLAVDGGELHRPAAGTPAPQPNGSYAVPGSGSRGPAGRSASKTSAR